MLTIVYEAMPDPLIILAKIDKCLANRSNYSGTKSEDIIIMENAFVGIRCMDSALFGAAIMGAVSVFGVLKIRSISILAVTSSD